MEYISVSQLVKHLLSSLHFIKIWQLAFVSSVFKSADSTVSPFVGFSGQQSDLDETFKNKVRKAHSKAVIKKFLCD